MRKPLLCVPESRKTLIIRNRLSAQKSYLKKKMNNLTVQNKLYNRDKNTVGWKSPSLDQQEIHSMKIEISMHRKLVIPSFNSIVFKCQLSNQILYNSWEIIGLYVLLNEFGDQNIDENRDFHKLHFYWTVFSKQKLF